MNEVTHYEKGKYDLAILHIDQQSIYDPEKGDRISKGRIYEELNETIDDIPKVVINHMTPFHDKYDSDKVVRKIKNLVGDNHMLVNSHTAQGQWGWGNSIIHGMTTDEWWDLPKEPRVVVSLSQAGMEKAYRRIFLHAVIRQLREREVPFIWIGVDRRFDSFDAYRDFLGRSLVYLHPAWQSPMPRARTEAMLSGACVVTTPYQDANTFIKEGENGFLTSKVKTKDPRIMDSPEYTADLLEKLVLHEPKRAREVGQRGKEFARGKFNSKNFAKQWESFLKEKGIL